MKDTWSLTMNHRAFTLRATVSLGIIVAFCGLGMATGASVSASQSPLAKQAASQAAQQPQDHPEFPQGQGRDTTLRVCSKCHSVNNLLASGRDREGWENIIIKMTTLGMQATDEEYTDIADYLTANFPPGYAAAININRADAKQLAAALALTPEEARAIVAYREKNGSYKTFDDLKKVPNIDPKKLDAGKSKIQF